MIYKLRYFIIFGLIVLLLGLALLLGRVSGEWFTGAITAIFGLFVGAGAWQSEAKR